jgi:diketogulonate reductase-like aldo/keto reductase
VCPVENVIVGTDAGSPLIVLLRTTLANLKLSAADQRLTRRACVCLGFFFWGRCCKSDEKVYESLNRMIRRSENCLTLLIGIVLFFRASSLCEIACTRSMPKRKHAIMNSSFRATPAEKAESLTDGVNLADNVILPWVGYGTYKLGKGKAYSPTLSAIQAGYRCIDTAFIYAGETTEREVGNAIQKALEDKTLSRREDVFLITKHWRKYHGYEDTKECLRLSLQRLQVDHIDLWLMHWPGPAYSTMSRRTDILEAEGPWHYATTLQEDMIKVRAETWRAMEDSLKEGKVRSIGVSNFSVQHLETLKATAKHWPPSVNQVECHPLYPQQDLVEYCAKAGIVVQAYAALGGQDCGKKKWREILNGQSLIECDAVTEIAKELRVTPAQVLLRWALQRGCAVTPKTTSMKRMEENADVFRFCLSTAHMKKISDLEVPGDAGRLCWARDPMRMLDFE